jgi:hypothetical protein
MQQAQAHVEDLRLDTESRLICKGSALVRFEYLNWNEYLKLNKVERPNLKYVEYVKRIFRKSGCSQLQVGHHIPAVVDQHGGVAVPIELVGRTNRRRHDP